MTNDDGAMKYCLQSAIIALTTLITACGGGGGGGANKNSSPPTPPPTPPPPAQTDFQAGLFRGEHLYKDMCLTPRLGTSDTQGTTEDENNWLRSWSNDLYLWYDEIVDADPAAHTTPNYFELMKTVATTSSGSPKDRFHFTQDTDEYQQLIQSGIQAQYGADWTLLSASPPREALFVYVQPETPAAAAGVARGDRILEIDGEDFVNGDNVAALNDGLFPNDGDTHNFLISSFDGTQERMVTMTAAALTIDPVPITNVIATPQGPVGYLYFVSYLNTSEKALADAFNSFEAAGITELIIDVRYNNGGLLDIANQLAYMIAGPAAAQGRIFDELVFNDKHPNTNPVTGAALSPTNFITTTRGFSVLAGNPLPRLNLSRVYLLVGPGTASANESVINSLLGIDFEVILVGERTTGKPYGFYPTDNCGITYFSIQFRTVNEKGFGDYADGFMPNEVPEFDDEVQGCLVNDDFTSELGDVAEARFATALGLIDNLDCAAATPAVSTLPNLSRRVLSGAMPSNIAVRSQAVWPGTIIR